MEFSSRKFILYVISIITISGAGLLIYDVFGLSERHTSLVQVFCDDIHENIGVTSTRSLGLLKEYSHNRTRFEERDAF